MVNYQKMYHILCAAVSDALDALPDIRENRAGRALLQESLYRAEELYIETAGQEEQPAER